MKDQPAIQTILIATYIPNAFVIQIRTYSHNSDFATYVAIVAMQLAILL